MNVSGLDLGSLDHWVPRRVWMCSVPFEFVFSVWVRISFTVSGRVRVELWTQIQSWDLRSDFGMVLRLLCEFRLKLDFMFGLRVWVSITVWGCVQRFRVRAAVRFLSWAAQFESALGFSSVRTKFRLRPHGLCWGFSSLQVSEPILWFYVVFRRSFSFGFSLWTEIEGEREEKGSTVVLWFHFAPSLGLGSIFVGVRGEVDLRVLDGAEVQLRTQVGSYGPCSSLNVFFGFEFAAVLGFHVVVGMWVRVSTLDFVFLIGLRI